MSWSRCGRGEPSPGADVAGLSPVPVPMWQGSPGADVAAVLRESLAAAHLRSVPHRPAMTTGVLVCTHAPQKDGWRSVLPRPCPCTHGAPVRGTPATSAPGLGSRLPHLLRDWAHPCHICSGTGLAPPTSAPGLGPPLPTFAPGLGLPLRTQSGREVHVSHNRQRTRAMQHAAHVSHGPRDALARHAEACRWRQSMLVT